MIDVRILLVASVCVILLLGPSCGRARPAPPSSAGVPDAPATDVAAAPTLLDRADADFAAGRLSEATAVYEALLEEELEEPQGQLARFRLGLIYASPTSPHFDIERALRLLNHVSGASNRSLAVEAALLAELLVRLQEVQDDVDKSSRELRRISEELEKLKAIDQERRRGGFP
jgi:hypothetical protein